MSPQVGSGHIAIFPQMKGFKSRVTRDVKSAGRASASGFAASMKGAGRSAGERVGRDLKSAVNASAGDLGAGALKGLSREVAAASAGLSKARLKQQDEAGKVRVAETRLAEAVAKHGATSSQAVAAEERLASARRAHKTATDTVTAATTRLKGAQDELNKAESAEASTSWWKRLGASAKTGAQGFLASVRDIGARAGHALGAALKGTATVGVSTAAAGITVALAKGFQRLTGIDSARAKLVGLGHDGKTVGTIMDNATASVRGTAFGLGEAATVAAGAVASGIKPGEQLEGVLKGVANVAAATNRTMEDTGSIFNNVRANQAAYTEDIKQLANAGLPIWDALQKATGKTQQEVRKMATAGEIDFDLFSKAAADAAGTVAESMGSTIPASIANFFASVGRIGANALGGINKETGEMYGLYAKIAPLIQAATSALGPLEERAKGWGETLERVVGPAMDWLTGLFEKVGSGSEDLKAKFDGLAPVLAPVSAAFLALGSKGLAGVLAGLPVIGPMLGGLTGPLAALGGPLGIAAAAFAGFALSGGDAGALVESLTGIIDQVVAALPGVVAKVAEFVPQLVEGILAQVPALLEAGLGIVNALIAGIVAALPVLIEGGIALITGLIDAIVTNLPMIIEGALQLVTGLLSGIVAALPLIIEGGIQLLMALVTGLIEALPMLLEAALNLVVGLLGAIIENLPMIIQAGVQLLLSLVEGLIGALPQIVTAAITMIIELVGALLVMMPQIIAAGIQLVIALIGGLISAIPMIIEMTPQIIMAIWDGLMDVDWASLGMDIVWGIIDGLSSMGGAITDAIKNVASNAFEGFKDFFGIASPAKRMMQPGRDVVRGAMAGVDDEASEFGDSLVAMADEGTRRAERALSGAINAPGVAGTSSGSASAVSTGGAVQVHQENHFAHEAPEVAVELTKSRLAFLLGGA